jgi:hypothetical protein
MKLYDRDTNRTLLLVVSAASIAFAVYVVGTAVKTMLATIAMAVSR